MSGKVDEVVSEAEEVAEGEPADDEAKAQADDAGAEAEAAEAEKDDGGSGEDEAEEPEVPVTEYLEQVGRKASTLVLREVELTTSRHIPELRRAARDLTMVLIVAVSFATAFALANWALVDALSSPLPGWRAPLVVMAIWLAVGALVTVLVLARAGRLLGWHWWRAVAADPEETMRERERARDEAEGELRESLQDFAGAVSREAGALIAIAVVPIAGGAAEAGEKVIDAVDDVTDVIEDKVPGGGVINRVADIALKPGRFALGAVNKGLGRDSSEDEPAKQE